MAVMKTCCGCFSTKSGTFAILLLYTAAYIACIVAISINLKGDTYQKWYKETVIDSADWQKECIQNTENKDSWKCKTSTNLQEDIKDIFIGIVVTCCIFLVAIILALIGTGKDKHWPILPWIILEFIRLIMKVVILVLVIILWAVNMSEGSDSSNLIATSVIGAVVMAFYFYVWLCVVSHFQTLKEITDLGLLDKGANGTVLPFVNEDGDGYSNPSTVNSTVNMRDNDDENADENKDELESVTDEDGNDKKDGDAEKKEDDAADDSPNDNANRPTSTKSVKERPNSSASSFVADTRPDAEEE